MCTASRTRCHRWPTASLPSSCTTTSSLCMPHILLWALCTLCCLLSPAELFTSYVLFFLEPLRRCSASCHLCNKTREVHVFGRALGLTWLVTRCRSSWLLFYIIEAVAVYSVLAKYPNDADAAVSCPDVVVLSTCWRRLLCFHLAAVRKSLAAPCDFQASLVQECLS